VYTVVFLTSVSPGAVLRFLERTHRPSQALNLLLSSPASSQSWRVLKSEMADEPTWWAILPERLGTVYPLFFVMQVDGESWTITKWQDGQAVQEAHLGHGWIDKKWSWLTNLTRNQSSSTLEAWGEMHKAPFIASFLRPPQKIIAYETVAVLDQRSLLAETEPLWYRFPLGA
jgi:hypothetical protein